MMRLDFTYIDDIMQGVIRCLDKPATPDPGFDPALPDPAISWPPHRVVNIGNTQPVELLHFIGLLEQALGRKATTQFEPMEPGNVEATAADTTRLEEWVGFAPATPLENGIQHFACCYRQYFMC